MAFAQSDETPDRNRIKFSVLRLFNPINPGVELSYERTYGKRFGTEVTLACMANIYGGALYNTHSGYLVGLNQRWYIIQHRTIRPFLSLEGFLQKTSFSDYGAFRPVTDAEDDFYYPWGDSTVYYANFSGKKQLQVLHLNWGFQYTHNHFMFELALGVGCRYRFVEHSDYVNSEHEMVNTSRHPNIKFASVKKGRELIGSANLNFRLGYTF
jgi:hypothetical protein